MRSENNQGWVIFTPEGRLIPGFASRDEAQAAAEKMVTDRLPPKKTRVAVRGGDIGMREMERWNASDRPYALLSAVQGGSLSERKERHAQLLQELQRLGLKHEDVRGQWEEASSGKMRAEPSLWIKDIDPETALALGRKFDQDASPGVVLQPARVQAISSGKELDSGGARHCAYAAARERQ